MSSPTPTSQQTLYSQVLNSVMLFVISLPPLTLHNWKGAQPLIVGALKEATAPQV